MYSLRQELANKKNKEEKIINEAAYAWLENNVILITEKLNKTAVAKLTNSIIKFDEKFGPYKDQLPEIKKIIEDAEFGLQLVLTGKTSSSKATDMFQKFSMIYSILSNFFGSDLATLLKTPIFKAAKENPHVKLNAILDPSHDPDVILSAIANALRPSKEQIKLLNKIYKNIPMPNLKADIIAKQLLNLSFEELKEISGIKRVPMVAIERIKDLNDNKEEDINFNSLNEEYNKENTIQLLEQVLNNTSFDQLLKALENLTAIFNSVTELKNTSLYSAVLNLKKEAQKAIASGSKLEILRKQGPAALFRDPVGIIIAQAHMAIEMFRKLGMVWPKIRPLFADGTFDEDEQKQLINILKKELEGGLLTKLKNMFKVPPFKGLTSTDIINVIANIASSTNQKTIISEDFEALQNFFTKLNTTFKSQSSNNNVIDDLTKTQQQPTISTIKQNIQQQIPKQQIQQSLRSKNNQTFDISDATKFELRQLEKATGIEADRLAQLGRNKFIKLEIDPRIFKNLGPL